MKYRYFTCNLEQRFVDAMLGLGVLVGVANLLVGLIAGF
jgi:hypothetical protein